MDKKQAACAKEPAKQKERGIADFCKMYFFFFVCKMYFFFFK